MQLAQRLLAPIGFAVVALCISLPFVAFRIVDRDGGFRQTWTGFDLTIGGRSPAYVDDVSSDVSAGAVARGQPAFMLAIVLVMAGLAAAILAGARVRAVVSAVAGFGAAVAIGVGEWVYLGRPVPTYDQIPEYGFWVTLVLLVGLGVDGVAMSIRRLI